MILETISATNFGMYLYRYVTKNKETLRKAREDAKKKNPKKPRVIPFTGNARNQQLKEFSADNINRKNPQQQLTDRNMAISAGSLGLAIIGKLFYFPIALLSLPGILYITHFAIMQAFKGLFKERKLTVDFLSAMMKILLLINGYLVFASFSVFMFSLNRKLLDKVSDNSRKNIIDVFKQQPSKVWVVYDNIEREISFDDLKTGDTVMVGAGSTIPVDGEIIEGSASVDQHILTGEFQPVEKTAGDNVFALTLVLSGKIYIHARETGQQTTAAQIAHILNNTISTKTDVQLWSREISDKSVLPTFAISAASMPFIGPVGALGVLNSHFKYRASIASAIGVMNYLDMASHNGILVKDGHTFELLEKVDTVVFDKTGTLTEEQPRVATIHVYGDYTEQEVLRYAAAAESKQSHPIARAILQRATDEQLELPKIEEAAYKLGYGLTVSIEGHIIRVGSVRFLEQEGIHIPDAIRTAQTACQDHGSPMIAVAIDESAVGAIELVAAIRPGTKELIHELIHECGIKSTYIISGDHDAPTRQLADELGINHYFAEVLPEQKAKLIKQLQEEGKSVCYVGDGINDSIALQEADVSVSIRGASTVATDAAQIVLMGKTLNQLPYLFAMGQQFNSHMKKVVATVVTPCVVSVGGSIIFFNLGLIQSFIFPQIGLLAGIAMAMRPVIKHCKQDDRRIALGKKGKK
jgi:Cu2+-exporting ATPase